MDVTCEMILTVREYELLEDVNYQRMCTVNVF